MDSPSNAPDSTGKLNTYHSVNEIPYKGVWLKEANEGRSSFRSSRYILLATLSACAEHCWEDAAKTLPLLFLQTDVIPMHLLLNLTNSIVRNSESLSYLKDSVYENFIPWFKRNYVIALGMINDELPDIKHENIPAFIEKMDNLCMIGEKARGQANREKFNRYKVLALGYTAVIMFCYYKEEYEREYGELQDLTETELDQDFEENKLEDIKEKARKQARIGLLRALEKFSWALYICDEP